MLEKRTLRDLTAVVTTEQELVNVAREQEKRRFDTQQRYVCVDLRQRSKLEVDDWLGQWAVALEPHWGRETMYYPLLYLLVATDARGEDCTDRWTFIVTDDRTSDAFVIFEAWFQNEEREAEGSKNEQGLMQKPMPGCVPLYALLPLDQRAEWFALMEELERANARGYYG